MGIDVSWLNDNQDVLVLKFSGTFNVEELKLSDKYAYELSENLDNFVYGIYDFSQITNYFTLPHGLLAYIQEKRRQDIRYAGVVVVIPKIGELLARSVMQIAKAVHRKNISTIHLVNHLDDAIEYINNLPSKSKEAQ